MAMPISFVTIGVYGIDEESFFNALLRAQVDTFCDIRWRRGVRGSQYAFANSQRLQTRLAELGIRYIHRQDLAPSPDLRAQQELADKREKTGKRKRIHLSANFVDAYRSKVLADFDSDAFLADLTDARVVALFCVERQPEACHRSLLAERLQQNAGVTIAHIIP